jgi:hypothetical protein
MVVSCSKTDKGKAEASGLLQIEQKDEKDGNEQSVFLDLSYDSLFYGELRNHYDQIELKYIRGESYIAGYGWKYFVLERLSYYGIKNNVKYFLGYVTRDGIYDKSSNLLKKVDPPEYLINLGVSSATLDYPWVLSYLLKDILKNHIWSSDPFAFIGVDFNNNSLGIYIPEY